MQGGGCSGKPFLTCFYESTRPVSLHKRTTTCDQAAGCGTEAGAGDTPSSLDRRAAPHAQPSFSRLSRGARPHSCVPRSVGPSWPWAQDCQGLGYGRAARGFPASGGSGTEQQDSREPRPQGNQKHRRARSLARSPRAREKGGGPLGDPPEGPGRIRPRSSDLGLFLRFTLSVPSRNVPGPRVENGAF